MLKSWTSARLSLLQFAMALAAIGQTAHAGDWILARDYYVGHNHRCESSPGGMQTVRCPSNGYRNGLSFRMVPGMRHYYASGPMPVRGFDPAFEAPPSYSRSTYPN